MTFEEWWEEETGRSGLVPSDAVKEFFARKAWQAATLAERERAAKVADGIADRSVRGEIFILRDVPDAIRKGEGV